MAWNLSKKELEKLKTEFQEEISNSNFGFNLEEISNKLQNLLLNRAFTNLFYDESLYICSQGRLHPNNCLLYTSPSPRDTDKSRMPSSA